MSYDSVVLAESSLVHFWKLNETVGSGTVADSKGAATGTVTGVTLGVAGIAPAADGETVATFNGTSNQITVSGTLETGAAFSYECQIKVASLTGSIVILQNGCFNGTGNFRRWVITATSGTLQVVDANAHGAPSTGGLLVSTAYHVVTTWDGANMHYYINGVLDSSPAVAALSTPGNNSVLGNNTNNSCGNGTNWLNATVGKIAIYNAALNQTQVTAHYNAFAVAGMLISVGFDSQMQTLNGGMK